MFSKLVLELDWNNGKIAKMGKQETEKGKWDGKIFGEEDQRAKLKIV